MEGSRIVTESIGSKLLVYLYDESGAPIGLQYRQSSYAANQYDTFFFEKNIFGDIVAVYNADGDKIGSYTYDAWGICTTTTESGITVTERSIVRTYNPFRYRGYFYDTDTGLYYLQSRYYNPQWGRFLNADGYVSTGTGLLGYNMYAYCNNNPVMYTDPSGELFVSTAVICVVAGVLIGAGIGACLGYAYAAGTDVAEEDRWKYAVGGALLGGAVGGLAGYAAAPAIVAATGIAGISITSLGITIVGVGGAMAAPLIEQSCTALCPYYPPNDGFSGTPELITLDPGTMLQRIGNLTGRFLAPAGTPGPMLSLPPNQIGQPTTILQVLKPIEVLAGRVAPWFYQLGGGIQYYTQDISIDQLIRDGFLEIIG